MLCPAGHANAGDATFCMVCGAPLAAPSSGPVTSGELTGPPNLERPAVHPTVSRGHRGLPVALAVVVFIGAIGIGTFLITRSGDDDSTAPLSDSPTSEVPAEIPPLQAAYDHCSKQQGGKTLTSGDEGRTISIDTIPYGPTGGLVCVLRKLHTSQAIVVQMDTTTSMMGVQQADDGDFHYQFSYRPDNGINMVITDTSAE